MWKRQQLKHDHLWRAVLKSPLILLHFVVPFFFGILISPVFTSPGAGIPWAGSLLVLGGLTLLIYVNGLFGAFFIGIPLYYFLNAVRFQNHWLYLLAGFAGGAFVNFLYPWYVSFVYEGGPFPAIADTPIAKLAVASYPILFGVCGVFVAHSFWKILNKDAAPAP